MTIRAATLLSGSGWPGAGRGVDSHQSIFMPQNIGVTKTHENNSHAATLTTKRSQADRSLAAQRSASTYQPAPTKSTGAEPPNNKSMWSHMTVTAWTSWRRG
jgi:hypothetical protein